MKIYKYWAMEKGILRIGQEDKEIKCYGGSNFSINEAVDKAREKIAKVQRRISGEKHVWDDYEVEIRENFVRLSAHCISMQKMSHSNGYRYLFRLLSYENIALYLGAAQHDSGTSVCSAGFVYQWRDTCG